MLSRSSKFKLCRPVGHIFLCLSFSSEYTHDCKVNLHSLFAATTCHFCMLYTSVFVLQNYSLIPRSIPRFSMFHASRFSARNIEKLRMGLGMRLPNYAIEGEQWLIFNAVLDFLHSTKLSSKSVLCLQRHSITVPDCDAFKLQLVTISGLFKTLKKVIRG